MVLVLTMATGLMTGCGSKGTEKTEQKDADTSADTTENITVTMASNPFVGLAPFYVAMDKGFFKDCGLDFSMVDFDDSSASCSALLAGKVDLAKCAKKYNLDAIHDTVHEMARDEARHGKALKGLLDRYFG